MNKVIQYYENRHEYSTSCPDIHERQECLDIAECLEELQGYVDNIVNNITDSLSTNIINDIVLPLQDKIQKLKKLVETFLITSGGTALTDELGNSENIGIDLKTITSIVNDIYSKIENITGESFRDITMEINPDYFISEDQCIAHITATSSNIGGKFEHIALWWNDEDEDSDKSPFITRENIEGFTADVEIPMDKLIDNEIRIKCKAQILGIEYTKSKTITRYNEFYIGGGSDYNNIFNVLHAVQLKDGMRNAVDINIPLNGDHIIIILGKSLKQGFIRADLNGIEIEFQKDPISNEVGTIVTIDNKEYIVLTSVNEYSAGNYNIDING